MSLGMKRVRTCHKDLALVSRALSNMSDGTTHDSIPRLLASEAEMISNFNGEFPRLFSSSSLIIERSRIPSYPRISGDVVLR